ncbi:hypothetical protein TRICI_005655 [Trichomonascus ciferrii]|uniref:Mediator complex subunit 15 KIX domain-containing protein n=1 Tax=Trichomonascus ciferrii TaxID=44093 RepID=A0A642UQJ9_9ASCO|nr:hypothetical protein TRICI_005655 [Trichomonascus ciferrii]
MKADGDDNQIQELRKFLMDQLVATLHGHSPHISDSQLRAIAVSFDSKVFEQADNLDNYLQAFENKFRSYGAELPNVQPILAKSSVIATNSASGLEPLEPLDNTVWNDHDLMEFLDQIQAPHVNPAEFDFFPETNPHSSTKP